MKLFSFLNAKPTKLAYSSLISYFKSNKFGSEPPVMTILSNLPPKDRCMILEETLKDDPNNFRVYDKLSMAYMKDTKLSAAMNCLLAGRHAGFLSSQNYETLKNKIEFMSVQYNGNFGSSTSYIQSLQCIERDYAQTILQGQDYSVFYNIIKDFCENKIK